MVAQHNPKRALIVVRLSRMTDESTSPERQRAACEQLCAARGWEVVGVAEDLDVSAGKTSPFERPALSQWIGDDDANPGRIGEFDVLVFFRVDRLVRRVRHLGKMIAWSEQYGVNLVSATETHFDLSSSVGRLIAQLVASFAEMELEAISERNTSSHRHNIQLGKWTGGVPPWGLLPVETPDGWRLVHDAEAVPVIQEVVERVLTGEPLRAIAHDLTERGIPTARDRYNSHQGREPKGYGWHSAGLKRALTSPTLLGYVTRREPITDAHGRVLRDSKDRKQFGPEEIVRGGDGSPVQRSEPILTKPVFDRLGVELADRENRKEPTKRSSALLLQVVFCDVCGRPAYRLKGGKGRASRYRCASAQYKATCGNLTVPEADLDDFVESQVLGLMGESERLSRVWDAGEDTAAELAEVDETLTDLVGQLGSGPYRSGTPQRATLDDRIAALAKTRDDLVAVTTRPAGWTWQPTGETFAEWWERQGVQERNVYLRSMGVSVRFDKREALQLKLTLGELNKMASEVKPTARLKGATDLQAAMTTHGVEGIEIQDGVEVYWIGGRAFYEQPTGEWVEIPTSEAGE
ncbi:recombinase family protein [Rhodococcus hoagii]|nr:recombinase family protein [Prescottella equi]